MQIVSADFRFNYGSSNYLLVYIFIFSNRSYDIQRWYIFSCCPKSFSIISASRQEYFISLYYQQISEISIHENFMKVVKKYANDNLKNISLNIWIFHIISLSPIIYSLIYIYYFTASNLIVGRSFAGNLDSSIGFNNNPPRQTAQALCLFNSIS